MRYAQFHKGEAPIFDCRGGTLWLAGRKTEQSGTPYDVSDGGRWPNILGERRDSDRRTAASDQFPKRPGWNGVYIPLYVGHEDAVP